MTYQELGMQLREIYPHLKDRPGSDEALGLYFVNNYPDYYDLVSPTAKRIKEVSERIPESARWTEMGRIESIREQVHINREEAESLSYMDVAIRAAGEGVGVETYEEMRKAEHHLHGQMALKNLEYELEKKRDEDALDAGTRELLTQHEVIERLHQTLDELIDRHDKERHELKKRALKIRIDHLLEELDGRTKAAAVQATGGERLESRVEDTQDQGDNRTEAEDGME